MKSRNAFPVQGKCCCSAKVYLELFFPGRKILKEKPRGIQQGGGDTEWESDKRYRSIIGAD